MSDETHAPANNEAREPPAIGRGISFRPHPQATHWGIAHFNGEAFERLVFAMGEAGEAILFAEVEHFSMAFVREKFGPGRYRVNWRRVDADTRKNHTLGNDELELLPLTPEGGAPRAPSVVKMACLACGAELAGRFCANCGTSAGARAAAAPPLAAPPTHEGFKDGVAFATQALKSTTDIARAEADERIKRYEIDVKATLERERMAHDKQLTEQKAWFERLNAGPKFDPNSIVEKVGVLVKEEVGRVEARLAELDARLEELETEPEDDDDDEPETPPATVEGVSWNDRIDAAGKFVDKVGAPIVNAIGDAVERIRKNGVAPNAQSGEST